MESAGSLPLSNIPAKDYVDQVRLTIAEAEMPENRVAALEWYVLSGGGDISASWVEDELKSFARSAAGGYVPNYLLDVSKKVYSWGSSSVMIEGIITLGGGIGLGMAGNAGWAALLGLADRVKRKMIDLPYVAEINENEAVHAARQILYNRHSVSPDLLDLTATEMDLETSSIKLTFMGPSNVKYSCEVRSNVSGGVLIAKISTDWSERS